MYIIGSALKLIISIGISSFSIDVVSAQDWKSESRQSAEKLSKKVEQFAEKVLGVNDLQVRWCSLDISSIPNATLIAILRKTIKLPLGLKYNNERKWCKESFTRGTVGYGSRYGNRRESNESSYRVALTYGLICINACRKSFDTPAHQLYRRSFTSKTRLDVLLRYVIHCLRDNRKSHALCHRHCTENENYVIV